MFAWHAYESRRRNCRSRSAILIRSSIRTRMRILRTLHLASAIALTIFTATAHAQSARGVAGYPNKPLRIIVSSAPGGGQDLTVRPVAQKLGEALGVSVVADCRGGASGIIAMDLTRQAAADGYTFMTAGTTMILQSVAKKVPYDIRT